ncbi:DUF3106 domain-containing protein [Arenimonas sp.]|uniref:DUF3106 domain-containing protein n=1 Tax=Arenimonas sp. TaxID=1872635 RepID=UPI0035B27384
MRRLLALALLAAALASPAAAHGRGDGPRHHQAAVPEGVSVPDWAQLTPAQQQALAPLRESWDTLPASRRVVALERAERRARWEAMTPGQRERMREGMRNYRDLPPPLREKMRESMRAVRALPDAERKALRERWRQLSPQQRRAWLEVGGPGVAPEPVPVRVD